jgi:tight adherence protein B
VGLESSLFDPSTLRSIAGLGNGEYLGAASPRALSAIYRSLGDQLANAYRIQYLSTAPTGSAVNVVVKAGNERATTGYTAPNVRTPGEIPASLKETGAKHEPFLSSTTGAAIVAIAVLLLVIGGIGLPFQQHARRVALRRRVADYGNTAAGSGLEDLTEARRRRGARMEALAERLELARMEGGPARFILKTVIGTFLLALVSTVIFKTGFAGFVSVIAGPLIARAILRRNVEKQRRMFADQLADSIQAVTSSMRTGNSFVGALSRLVDDAPEPTASEFRRVMADERLGVPLDTALARMVARMDNKDLQQVGLVTVIQRETGGNGAEALDRVVGNIRARDDIRRLVRTLSSQGRLSQGVLTALPVATALVLKLVGGSATDPLFKTGYGHALLGVAAAMIATGGAWIGRIIKVKV